MSIVAEGDPRDLGGLTGWVAGVIDSLGEVGVGLLVALENLIPPVPSELVLTMAGYLAGNGRLNVVLVVIAATIGSVVGALILYWLGRMVGEDRLRRWLDRIPLVDADDLDKADRWFERHAWSAVLFGRMVPVVRSLVSIPAGANHMPIGRFVTLHRDRQRGVELAVRGRRVRARHAVAAGRPVRPLVRLRDPRVLRRRRSPGGWSRRSASAGRPGSGPDPADLGLVASHFAANREHKSKIGEGTGSAELCGDPGELPVGLGDAAAVGDSAAPPGQARSRLTDQNASRARPRASAQSRIGVHCCGVVISFWSERPFMPEMPMCW